MTTTTKLPTAAQAEVLRRYDCECVYVDAENGRYRWMSRSSGHDGDWANHYDVNACLHRKWIEVGYYRNRTPAGDAALAAYRTKHGEPK